MQRFSAVTGRVGGSWGAGSGHQISSFWAFENDDCTGAVKAEISRKGSEHGFCFDLKSTLGCVLGWRRFGQSVLLNSARGNR